METIRIPDGAYSHTLHGMTDKELKTILPAVRRQYRHAVKMVDFYEDLIIDGYGTSRQTTAHMDWQEKAETLSHILNYAKDLK